MGLERATSATRQLINQHRIKLQGRIIRTEKNLIELKEQLRHHDELFPNTDPHQVDLEEEIKVPKKGTR